MTLLICQPVCRRSAPEKIERWISHLEQLKHAHGEDPDALRTIDAFLTRARTWVDR